MIQMNLNIKDLDEDAISLILENLNYIESKGLFNSCRHFRKMATQSFHQNVEVRQMTLGVDTVKTMRDKSSKINSIIDGLFMKEILDLRLELDIRSDEWFKYLSRDAIRCIKYYVVQHNGFDSLRNFLYDYESIMTDILRNVEGVELRRSLYVRDFSIYPNIKKFYIDTYQCLGASMGIVSPLINLPTYMDSLTIYEHSSVRLEQVLREKPYKIKNIRVISDLNLGEDGEYLLREEIPTFLISDETVNRELNRHRVEPYEPFDGSSEEDEEGSSSEDWDFDLFE